MSGSAGRQDRHSSNIFVNREQIFTEGNSESSSRQKREEGLTFNENNSEQNREQKKDRKSVV